MPWQVCAPTTAQNYEKIQQKKIISFFINALLIGLVANTNIQILTEIFASIYKWKANYQKIRR
jgi:hypothetical protein